MTRTLHVAHSPGERRFAVAEGDGLLHYEVARPGRPDRVEEVSRARVEALAAAQKGAFLRLPGDALAFLPGKALPRGTKLVQGQTLCVRISRAAIGGKGLRVVAKGVEQTAGPAPAVLHASPDVEARLRRDFAPASVLRAEKFPAAIDDTVATLADPDVALPGGGRIRVWPTPALVAIDVDAGGATAAAANALAVAAVAGAIVLRNLSGVIHIDFAGLDSRAQKTAMAATLRDALAGDPLRAEVTGHSPAGLVEVVRARVRPPLHEVLGTANAPWSPTAETVALGALRQALIEALADPMLRPSIRAHAAVITALRGLPQALAEFSARAGGPPMLVDDATLPFDAPLIETARHG
jgi:glyoxylase-like metal-dependent hydrolase (beta-lactamase superfamily II)